jgi:hypothetical protein
MHHFRRQACLFFFMLSLSTVGESELTFDFRRNMCHHGVVPEGFLWKNGFRIPFAFSHSQSRLGVDNGNYIDLAAKFKSSLHYRRQLHDWSTALFVGESYSMTPVIENRFIKSQDIFRVETRYLYNILPWLSPYVHARMETSLFKSIDIDSSSMDFEIRNADGLVQEKLSTKELRMADPFRPLFFQENIGVALQLMQKGYFDWEARGGVSARQTIADGQRVFVEEKDEIRIIQNLHSFFQIGPTLGTTLGGTLYDDKVEYTIGADSMWPMWQRPKPEERDFLKSVVLEANAGIAFSLTSWSSLGYEYSTTRIPDIHPKFQQNHSLTVNISFDWAYEFGAPQAEEG